MPAAEDCGTDDDGTAVPCPDTHPVTEDFAVGMSLDEETLATTKVEWSYYTIKGANTVTGTL